MRKNVKREMITPTECISYENIFTISVIMKAATLLISPYGQEDSPYFLFVYKEFKEI